MTVITALHLPVNLLEPNQPLPADHAHTNLVSDSTAEWRVTRVHALVNTQMYTHGAVKHRWSRQVNGSRC
jgi:hypothetical protein